MDACCPRAVPSAGPKKVKTRSPILRSLVEQDSVQALNKACTSSGSVPASQIIIASKNTGTASFSLNACQIYPAPFDPFYPVVKVE